MGVFYKTELFCKHSDKAQEMAHSLLELLFGVFLRFLTGPWFPAEFDGRD